MVLQRFIIERDIPKVGTFEREQLRQAAAKSNDVLRQLGPDIQWVESYVADNKTFCVYLGQRRGDHSQARRNQRLSGDQNHRSEDDDRSNYRPGLSLSGVARRESGSNPICTEIFQRGLANYPVASR